MVVNDADIHTFSVLAYTLNFSFREKKLFFVCFFLYKVDNRGSEMPVKIEVLPFPLQHKN